MCGIAGFVGEGERNKLEAALHAIKHRGPDDSGILLRDGIGFAHARLAIIDTSEKGHQPMLLPDASVAITFNGEIYNFKELRAELKKAGVTFASDSDTEVLLQLYVRDGDDFLKNVRGMFALALYDFKNKKLILARDRMGEKPLYWTTTGETLWFGSEMKALFAVGIEKKIDMIALNQYLQFDYVPTPRTMIDGVHKVEPGTMLMWEGNEMRKKKFWDPPRAADTISERDALQKLDTLLADSVQKELVSDVPLGVFLSGGLDSSTIAYYAKAAGKNINTFSIGFDDVSFDESTYARRAAEHIGTAHHALMMREDDALDLVQEIPEVFSEPVADASVIPTLFLSRFARQSVTVALGGDGGDELFAGYPTFQADSLFALYRHVPRPVRHFFARAVQSLPASHANFALSYNLQKFTASDSDDPIHRHLGWLGTFSEKERTRLVKMAGPVFEEAEKYAREFHGDAHNRLLYLYMRTYLMDQVLVKVDRASMHYALETRAPFLDHTVVDFMLSLPCNLKYRRGTTKYLLKQLMKDKLPRDIVFRKKKGFGIPLARWLTGPLKPLCEELLSSHALSHGLFNEKYVAELKDVHMSGRNDYRKELWNLMVFQMWYKRWMM